MNRREVLKLGILSTTVAVSGAYANTHSDIEDGGTQKVDRLNGKTRVVIIGGGFAGLSVAKNIRLHDKKSEILVFEPKNIFASCPYSNLWLGGVKGVSYEKLLFSPLDPASKYGYEIVEANVSSIDRKRKIVSSAKGDFEYSLLVVATGIEYDYSTFGLDRDEAKRCYKSYPPSYSGGYEQLTLKKKIEKFKGGVFVITVPKGSYRCPPAPYERACMVAEYFKSKKIDAKIKLIDPREKPTTKSKGFLSAFNDLYSDYIEYMPMSSIEGVDVVNKIIKYDIFDEKSKKFVKKELKFDDANIIPSNRATRLLQESGLETTEDGWGRAKSPTFQSLNDKDIYLVGDVLGEYPFPKSAQMAHSCSTILGEQIAARIKGKKIEAKYPSNVCYSMVSSEKAIAVTHEAYVEDGSMKTKVELFQDANKETARATHAWFEGITENIFS